MCLQKKDILTIVLLSIITCGIYSLYWLVVTTDDLNALEQKSTDTSGTVCLLLTIITCGLYGIYWYYKLGERLAKLNNNDSLPIIGLLCAIFSAGIIANVIYQDEINKYLDNYSDNF